MLIPQLDESLPLHEGCSLPWSLVRATVVETCLPSDLAGQAEQCEARWFRHIVRVEEDRLVKMVRSSVRGVSM